MTDNLVAWYNNNEDKDDDNNEDQARGLVICYMCNKISAKRERDFGWGVGRYYFCLCQFVCVSGYAHLNSDTIFWGGEI